MTTGTLKCSLSVCTVGMCVTRSVIETFIHVWVWEMAQKMYLNYSHLWGQFIKQVQRALLTIMCQQSKQSMITSEGVHVCKIQQSHKAKCHVGRMHIAVCGEIITISIGGLHPDCRGKSKVRNCKEKKVFIATLRSQAQALRRWPSDDCFYRAEQRCDSWFGCHRHGECCTMLTQVIRRFHDQTADHMVWLP